jgi:hypothetical protein
MSNITKVNRDRAKSRGFAALGIPIGSTLVFKKDPAVTVKTLDDKNKVEYLGKPYSISTLAKHLAGSPVSGYLYFKFEGKVLKSLAKSEVKPDVHESADPVPAIAERAVNAPDALGKQDEEAADDFGRGLDPLAGGIEEDSPELSPSEAGIAKLL